MSKISDEMREWEELLKRSAYTKLTAEKISAFADRIDAEMVELPKDADGNPIHVWDTVYDLDGCKHTAVILRLYGEEDPTWMVSVGTDACVHPSRITHERPDSLERIADELEEWSEDNRVNGDDEIFSRAREIAERIRRLAKERGDE